MRVISIYLKLCSPIMLFNLVKYRSKLLNLTLRAAHQSPGSKSSCIFMIKYKSIIYVPVQASVHTAKNKLTKNVQEKGLDPAEFRKTYMSLKTKQLFELDPYTYFLGKVS